MNDYVDYRKMADDAVGKTVQRKGTEKRYEVKAATEDLRVLLVPITKGAKKCYKWIGHLWLDFTEVK